MSISEGLVTSLSPLPVISNTAISEVLPKRFFMLRRILYDELESLKVIAPARVKHLSKLIDYLLSPLLESERALMLKTQEKLYQQSRINETIQMYKEQGASPSQSYLYEKETALLTKVRTGNIAEVKALLNDLLGYVLFSEGGNLDAVRTRAIELTTLLSRVAMDGGAKADSKFCPQCGAPMGE